MPRPHFPRRNVHYGVGLLPADRCRHGIVARELGDEGAARLDLRHAGARRDCPVHGDIADGSAGRGARGGGEFHDVTGARRRGRRLDGDARNVVGQHLEGERFGRRTGGRGDRGAARSDGAQPAIVRHGRDARVARREGHRIGTTIAVPRKRRRGYRESRARDQTSGPRIEVDARRRFGENVDEGGAEHLASRHTGDVRYGGNTRVSLITGGEYARRIHLTLHGVVVPTDLGSSYRLPPLRRERAP